MKAKWTANPLDVTYDESESKPQTMETIENEIDYINELLEESIDKAVLYILDSKIQLQIKKKAQMHPDSIIFPYA